MMKAEATTETVERFTEIWINDSTEFDRLIPELISVSNETNRRPDTSYFTERDGELIDPDSKRPVLEFIAPGTEYKVAEELQSWVADTDEGMAIWVSPKLENTYPCNKALIYQIVHTPDLEKAVQYSAILFDGDIQNPEEYRKTLLTFEDDEENLVDMLSWIEEVSGQDFDKKHSKDITQKAAYFAEKIKNGADKKQVVKEMRQSGFLGSHSVSCPAESTTFSEFSLKNAKIIFLSGEKFLLCQCPFCKRKVKAKISSGEISCPECRASAKYKC